MSESVQSIPPFVQAPPVARRRAATPTRGELVKHSALFLLTFLSTTFAGIMLSTPAIDIAEPATATLLDYVLYVPDLYVRTTIATLQFAWAHPLLIAQGIAFAASLLTILLAHEMGHYLACRFYGVDATLPFFIPAPPLFLAGTFGAFIKMKLPIPSKRALFDIGLAGPLAGFVMLLPFALLGVTSLQPAPPSTGSVIIFNDPLLIRIIGRIAGVSLADAQPNPFYMAAWIGLLVTSLNLMPVGQLDGGHGTFAVFGARTHKLVGRIVFVVIAAISVLGFVWYGSPSGFLYTVLLAVMLRVHHPEPQTMEPLGTARVVIGIVTLIIFALSFWPFPVAIT